VALQKLSVSRLISSLGLATPLSEREQLENICQGFFEARSHRRARVAELRWNRLILEAPAQDAALLRLDTDVLLEELRKALPGLVSEVVVRVAR
jgi:hypothetical protein